MNEKEPLKFLRQEPHGHIYPWNERIAARKDMTLCDSKGIAIGPVGTYEKVAPSLADIVPPAGVVQDPSSKTDAKPKAIDEMNTGELMKFAADNGITIPATVKKLETLRERVLSAQQAMNPTPTE